MTEKYYTPTLEEFHIGFEYEIAGLDNYWGITGWIKEIVNEDFNYKLLKQYPQYYRVKYLDKEDLEDIGFIIEEEEIKPYGHYLKGKFKNNTELWYAKRQDNEKIYVSLKSKRYNGNIRVRIKNKCDLVKIMKQSEML